MYDLGYAIGAFTSWVMVLFGLYRLRQTGWHDRGRQALCAAFLCSALGQMVSVSWVATYLANAFDVPNVNRLLAYVCATLVGVCEAVLVAHWVSPDEGLRRLPRRLAFSAMCLLGLVVTFTLGNVASSTQHFTAQHAGAPFVACFLLIYVAVQTSYLADIALVASRLSRVAQGPWTARGLRLVAVGGVVGVLDAVSKAVFVGIALAGGANTADSITTSEEPVSSLIVMVASLFLLAGWALPSLAPQLDGVRQRLTCYRQHRQLYPLWKAFHEAIPTIALDPPTGRWQARWSPRDLELRALRRVIEIYDGRLGIAGYIDPAVAEDARRIGTEAGLSDEDLAAVIEATQIRVGLDGLAREESPPYAVGAPTYRGFDDIAPEMQRLATVSRAFATSAVVAAAHTTHYRRQKDTHQ